MVKNIGVVKMNCHVCNALYFNDLDLNSHLLFQHGILRPMCSSKIDEKKMQIAELMKGDFDHARNRGKILDCFYIITKMHEMGLADLRKIYKRGRRIGTDKKGRPTYSRVEIPISVMQKELKVALYKDTYEARIYNDRYDLSSSKKPNVWYKINDEERNIEGILNEKN